MTGGYLVLDPSYSGLVMALSARFYTRVSSCTSFRDTGKDVYITVKSPQFTDGLWEYTVQENGSVEPVIGGNTNTYVHKAISYTLLFVKEMSTNWKQILGSGLEITIQGDNDFYSQKSCLEKQGLGVSLDSLKGLPRFNPLGCSMDKIHKTGLGSSAAMMSSVVGSLLTYFKVCRLDTVEGEQMIHNLTQFCHCSAQGKIGSGFDVSAAVYASHEYRRFSPEILNSFLVKAESGTRSGVDLVQLVMETTWDNQVKPQSLPRGLQLLLGDVQGGSSTPKMASKILQWRRENPKEANILWEELGSLNAEFGRVLSCLSEMSGAKEYTGVMDKCSKLLISELQATDFTPNEWRIATLLLKTRQTFEKIREQLRQLSLLTGVPVEPSEQTELLDSILKKPGVVSAGVPGAGGADAIFALCIGSQPVQTLQDSWCSSKETCITPLLCSATFEGIKEEL